MGGELQEVVEVCGKPEAFRVVIQFGPGTRAEQGGLVGWCGPQQQRAAVGAAPLESGGPGWSRWDVGLQAEVAAAADEKVGDQAPPNAFHQAGCGQVQHLGTGRPVVAAPEQEPVAGSRQRKSLVHGAEDAGAPGVLLQPTEAPVAEAEGIEPGPVFGTAAPVDERDLPAALGLGLE